MVVVLIDAVLLVFGINAILFYHSLLRFNGQYALDDVAVCYDTCTCCLYNDASVFVSNYDYI